MSSQLLKDFRFLPDENDRKVITTAFKTVEDLLAADANTFKQRLEDTGNQEVAQDMADMFNLLKRHLEKP